MFRKTSIICLEVVLGIAVVLALLGGVSAWRLSQGPVSIRFLLPYTEDLLNRADSPVQADMDDLILTWAGWERALDVRAVGVRLMTGNIPRPLARIREVSVTLSFRALVQGKVLPTSLELIRPLVRLTRNEDGAFRFGVGETDSEAEEKGEDLLAPLLTELSRPSGSEGSLRYLNRVAVIGAVLRVEDRKLGVTWGARHADFTVERAPIGLRAAFDLAIDLRPSQPEIDGEAYYNREKNVIDVAASFRGINPEEISRRFESLAEFQALKTDFTGDLDLQIGLDGDIRNAQFNLAAAAGTLTVPGVEAPPVAFDGIDLKGRLNRNPDQVQITGLTIRSHNVVAELAGVVTRVGGVAAVNATLGIPQMPVDTLQNFWLPGIGGGARDWVVTNMRRGTVTDATASLTARFGLSGEDAGAVDVDSINGRFSISDVTIDYLAPLPPITNASATATFSTKRFDFAVHGGRVGKLVLEDGAVNITDIGARREFLGVTALIRGPVDEALGIVAHPRLNLLSRVGLTTDGVAGTHATRLQIDFPLLVGLKAEDVKVSSSSNIDGLKLSNILKGRGVTNGQVALAVDNGGLSANGTVNYAETPTRFSWQEDFSGENRVVQRLEAKLTADADLRTLFGLDYPEILEGPVPVSLIYEERRDGISTLSAGLNLKDAKFSVPGFDWAKLPDRPGTAQLTAMLKSGSIAAIDSFNIEAGVFAAAGTMAFEPQPAGAAPELATLRLNTFKLGSTEFAADVRRAPDRSYQVAISGKGLDASPFIGTDLAGVDTPKLPPFSLNSKFDKFWIGPGAPANNVQIKLHHDGARWQQIEVDGELPDGGKAININMRPNSEGHELGVFSADAGALLHALDITDTIRGGTIAVTALREGGPTAPWNGRAKMSGFRVADAPSLARLMTLASLTGISDVVAGKGIAFRDVRFPFTFENDVAVITDAQAVGSELGITATGRIDFGKDAIDLNGTIVPAYTINSLLGKIPVIGTFLTGEKGGGIFAATYSVKGPVEKPEMSVNPLSALAPGFLRKLLGDSADGQNEGKTPTQEERLREKQNPGGVPNE